MKNKKEKIKTPKGVISIKKAIALNDTWSKTRAGAMNQCISDVTGGKIKEDNRSSWWSVKDVKKYLKYAKAEAKAQGYKMSGVRIYCGAHSEDDCFSTLFMVPTAQGSLGKDVGDPSNDDISVEPFNKGRTGVPPGVGYMGG